MNKDTEERSGEEEEANAVANMFGSGAMYEGDLIKMEAIKDKNIEVLQYKFAPSQYREDEDYLCLQIEFKGETFVVNTNGQALLNGFKAFDPANLPVKLQFYMQPSKGGRDYWWIRDWQEEPKKKGKK